MKWKCFKPYTVYIVEVMDEKALLKLGLVKSSSHTWHADGTEEFLYSHPDTPDRFLYAEDLGKRFKFRTWRGGAVSDQDNLSQKEYDSGFSPYPPILEPEFRTFVKVISRTPIVRAFYEGDGIAYDGEFFIDYEYQAILDKRRLKHFRDFVRVVNVAMPKI